MRVVIGVVLLALAATAHLAAADPLRGYDEYMRYCSACHGESGQGDGPVANVLNPRPPSLRNLHGRYGKPLATSLVAYVMGTTMPRAHGTSDMPVWGRNLAMPDGNDSEAVHTIWRIVDFLESIQWAPQEAPPGEAQR